ncbi:uncharacterized [Tachysurus ichikawai]
MIAHAMRRTHVTFRRHPLLSASEPYSPAQSARSTTRTAMGLITHPHASLMRVHGQTSSRDKREEEQE